MKYLSLCVAVLLVSLPTAAAADQLPVDHTVNHPTNRIVREKAELLKMVDSGTVRYKRFERRPEAFLFYRDMVVVMGAWMLQDGKWRLAFRHANNVSVPAPAAAPAAQK